MSFFRAALVCVLLSPLAVRAQNPPPPQPERPAGPSAFDGLKLRAIGPAIASPEMDEVLPTPRKK